MIFVPHLIQELFFHPLRFQKTRAHLIFNVIDRVFRNAILHYVCNGMPKSSQKFYFQVLGNSQKSERVFFLLDAKLRELGGED